ncbi:beta-glucosidase [Sphingomonas sp.]|uniref:beta-glucosidase n=1 Tax=Sphingomonas sp. TaxID=28214 RepID=UPI003B00A634
MPSRHLLLLAGGALALLSGPLRAESARDRAVALVDRMTQDEKLHMVHGWWYPNDRHATPGMPVGDWVPSAGYIQAIPRLGIPALRESDAGLGVANQVEERPGDTATAMPSALAQAASFDPEIARVGGVMIGAEARAKRFNILLAGGVNLTRDPWGGRNFEYYGEDPLLAGHMAGAVIAGVQSNRIISTVKHFVLNAQETGRHVLDARLADEPMRESDLLAFRIAIDEGKPAAVMCAYNKVNGDYACENRHTLIDILKGEWRYPGWVMSDWGAVHSTDKAALAGLDQQSGQQLDKQVYFGAPLARSVAAGRVPQARLDDMVARILTGLISSGAMDAPLPKEQEPIDYAAHAAVAQHAAAEGIVLLKNEHGALPLAASAKRIVVIGGHADVGVLSGGGSSQVRSVGGVPVEIPVAKGEAAGFTRITWHGSSPLKAIRALVPGADVTFVDGHDPAAAARAAKAADVAIVFAWQWQTESRDVATLALPDRQDATIAAVAAVNRRTVVVLETGGPVLMPWLAAVPAVIEAWYPGQRGGEAIADALFGRTNPAGRLPMTFPAAASQAPRPSPPGLAAQQAHDDAPASVPAPESFTVEYPEGANVGYRWYEHRRETPLFPFGHGLSYTRFRYADLRVDGAVVSFAVTNVGKAAGTDVPQVYVRAPDGAGVETYRLAGWSRLTLASGATRRVSVILDARAAATWRDGGWRMPARPLPLAVGHDAMDRALTGSVSLPAPSVE